MDKSDGGTDRSEIIFTFYTKGRDPIKPEYLDT